MNNFFKACLLIIVFSFSLNIKMFAQSTFSKVYTILQTNCAGSGCHDGSVANLFDVTGTQNDVYQELVNVAPLNPAALAKGDKLVAPGYPVRSFLLRKIAHGISPDLDLEQPEEGADMPSYLAPLPQKEIEMVRQWIMYGAPMNGTVVNEQVIADFYDYGGLVQVTAPAPPAPGTGFQIHTGPIFLLPNEEREYHWKYETHLPEGVEVSRLNVKMSWQSHHLILYKYHPGQGQTVQNGLKLIDNLLAQADVNLNASTLATWQYDRDHELPDGTAYFWEQNTILNSNFHIKNYSQDSILAAHAYINVYTRPQGSGAVQMLTDLIIYGGRFNPTALVIPNTGIDSTYRIVQGNINEIWNVWVLQAHTHKLGKDYNIWLRNADGSKGEQIYKGSYNADYTFDQGLFDWSHPPVREFSPMLSIDMNNGMIHEATYNNSGPKTIRFGITTDDEMFITYIHYTLKYPVGIRDLQESPLEITVFPNPAGSQFAVNYSLPESGLTRMELYNLLGKNVQLFFENMQEKGSHQSVFDISKTGIPDGVYLLRITSGNFSSVKKVILAR